MNHAKARVTPLRILVYYKNYIQMSIMTLIIIYDLEELLFAFSDNESFLQVIL